MQSRVCHLSCLKMGRRKKRTQRQPRHMKRRVKRPVKRRVKRRVKRVRKQNTRVIGISRRR